MHVEIRLTHGTLGEVLESVRAGKNAAVPVSETRRNSGGLLLVECPSATRRLVFSPRTREEEGILQVWTENDVLMMSPLTWEGETFEVARVVAMSGEKGVDILPRHQNPSHYPSRMAVSLGEALPRVLPRLRIVVVGTSRTGSHLAWGLLRFRPEKLILVDPDVWEPHHRDVPVLVLGESVMGRSKAVSLAETLEILAREEEIPAQVVPVPRAVWDVPVDLLAEADVLVSAVDNLAARLYLDVVAESFRALLLDVGVEASDDDWGGAVRVFWPEGPRLREVLPVSPEHWQQLYERRIPSGESHGALPPVAQMTAAMAQMMLLSALEGGVESGNLRWNWHTFQWNWQPWTEVPRPDVSFLGKGKRGLMEFQGWMDSLFG